MGSAQHVFDDEVKGLSATERLRLAALILDDLTQSSADLDISDAWSDEDVREVTAFSLDSAGEAEVG